MPGPAIVWTCLLYTSPVFAGALPESIYPLVSRVCGVQELTVEAAVTRNLDLAFQAFCMDPNMEIGLDEAKCLFDTMVDLSLIHISVRQETVVL